MAPGRPRDTRAWTMKADGATAVVALSGDWIARLGGAETVEAEARGAGEILGGATRRLAFDAGGLGRWDTALIAFLSDLRDAALDREVAFDAAGLPQPAQRLLALARRAPPPPPRAAVSRLAGVGAKALDVWARAGGGAALVGAVCLRGGVALRGGAAMRGRDLLAETQDAGPAALPIVGFVNLLVGGILGFIAATVLRKLGAQMFVSSLVGNGMVREMAALMTAVIMAGRTGGAYAASLAAMNGAEEIDALEVIGVRVFDYLVLPKVLALTAMMPILYLWGCVAGVAGGMAVAVSALGVSPRGFLIDVQSAVPLNEFILGFAKSLAFGALIAMASCQVGLRAGRSAAAVGRAATSAVVAGIVGVIALDSVFDVCAYALGI